MSGPDFPGSIELPNPDRRRCLAGAGWVGAATALQGLPSSLFAGSAKPPPAGSSGTPAGDVQAVRALLRRVLGVPAGDVELELLPDRGPDDGFEYSARKGRVRVRAGSASALARGFYSYLRANGLGMRGWSGQHFEWPGRWPDASPRRAESPYRWRQYLNVCTFGYSAAWWDWPRWERELDWMALHGINMALALCGQELIWWRTWRALGVSRTGFDRYITGPAFLPWHWMGNINGHGSAPSDSWHEAQRDLQHRILARMRGLGIQPVVPGFAGFVPGSWAQRHPELPVTRSGGWAGFPESELSLTLAPTSPEFNSVARQFVAEYQREYGRQSYFLIDSFNEMQVPVSAANRDEELARIGAAVFRGLDAASPQATWVLQGWMFGNDRQFWTPEAVRALLREVPDGRLLILDLANEFFHGWREHDSFHGKQWIYSTVANFGGNNALHGDLGAQVRDAAEMLAAKPAGLAGFGFAPEGIGNNEVLFELLTDLAWSRDPLHLDQWLPEMLRARYGKHPPAVCEAWRGLLSGVYAHNAMNSRHAFQLRPIPEPRSELVDAPSLGGALAAMRDAAPALADNPLFANDLVDIAAAWAGRRIDAELSAACAAHRAGDALAREQAADRACKLMQRLDTVLDSRTELRLEEWIAAARARGADAAESDSYERDARLQVTVWGGPDLHDYAAKLWSGLVRDFYLPRWRQYFAALAAGRAEAEIEAVLQRFELEWVARTGLAPAAEQLDITKAVDLLVSQAGTRP